MAEKKDEEEEKAGENQSEGAEKPEGQQPKADEGEEPNKDVSQEKTEDGKEADQEAAAEREEESAPKDKPEEESEEAVEGDVSLTSSVRMLLMTSPLTAGVLQTMKVKMRQRSRAMVLLRRYIQTPLRSSLDSFCFNIFVFGTRTVRMRRWGTCSWPGRCWKSLKAFTKGFSSSFSVYISLSLLFNLIKLFKFVPTRKDTKEAQLLAAQAHLKLGEVSAESGTRRLAFTSLICFFSLFEAL